MRFPSSSTSSISGSTGCSLSFLGGRDFFLGAFLRAPTALLPPELVVLTSPGAGRLARLLGCRVSGAGVFRAVLARRGRSAASEGCGSWLIVLPRERGLGDGASGAGVVRGVAPWEVDCFVGGIAIDLSCCCCCCVLFAASCRVSRLVVSQTGVTICVIDFFGDMAGGGIGVSAGDLVGTIVVTVPVVPTLEP